jgi:hypothetical protein
MDTWLRIAIAFVVFCHGFVYVGIGSRLPGPIADWSGSWLLGHAVTTERLTTLAIVLHVVAGIVMLACALAIGFAPSLPGWWRPLAMTGALVGIVAFAVFWDGQTWLLLDEGLIGAILSMVLLTSAVAFPGAFR